MKSTSDRRLRVEGLEVRTLLAACPVGDAPDWDAAGSYGQTPAVMANEVAVLAPGQADTQLSALAEKGAAHAKQVERPLKMQATSQAVVSLIDGSLHAKASGVATHLGRYTVEGSGWFLHGTIRDEGVIAAANGDLIFYTHEAGKVILINGTGRFEGVSGGFTTVPEMVGDPIIDPIARTMTMNFVWTATGTIKY